MDKFSRPAPPKKIAIPVAKAGYVFILLSAFITALFAFFGWAILFLLGLILTLFVCFFFRDPERIIPEGRGAVISPADGKIISAGSENETPFFEGECQRVSIFMSIFNVHVNRIPYEGRVNQIRYVPGKFFSAHLDKASRLNEHNAIFLETGDGKNLCVVQIAGLIARRIICRIKKNDHVTRGERFGMIRFGSRLDVYLPKKTKLQVAKGDKVKAGASILGYFL